MNVTRTEYLLEYMERKLKARAFYKAPVDKRVVIMTTETLRNEDYL